MPSSWEQLMFRSLSSHISPSTRWTHSPQATVKSLLPEGKGSSQTPFLAIRIISTALGTIIILTLALSIFALARKRLSGAPLLATAGTIAWRGTVVIVVAASTKAAIAWISLGWFVGRFNESLGQYMSKNENYVFDIQPLEDFPWHQIELWLSLVALLFCVLALILTANARLEKETAGLV